MTCAAVKVLPEPVTPSSTWSRSSALMPSTSSAMAVGWSPLGSYSDTSLKATPPSDFSGRGGRCGMNSGRLPDTSGCAAIIGCSASTCLAFSERSCGLASSALRLAVMLSMLREGGPTWRSAGRVDGDAGRNGACGASANPCATERRVSGVPPAPSTGGGAGLPDLPREGRGRGVLSLGARGMGRYMAPWPQEATLNGRHHRGC